MLFPAVGHFGAVIGVGVPVAIRSEAFVAMLSRLFVQAHALAGVNVMTRRTTDAKRRSLSVANAEPERLVAPGIAVGDSS